MRSDTLSAHWSDAVSDGLGCGQFSTAHATDAELNADKLSLLNGHALVSTETADDPLSVDETLALDGCVGNETHRIEPALLGQLDPIDDALTVTVHALLGDGVRVRNPCGSVHVALNSDQLLLGQLTPTVKVRKHGTQKCVVARIVAKTRNSGLRAGECGKG